MSLAVTLKHRQGDFNLDVAFATQHGVTALFGRSGSGKTTIAAMLAGLRRPQQGWIAVRDRVLFDSDAGIDVPPFRRRVGMVFQEPRLFPHLSVRANLLYGRWAGGRRGAVTLDAITDLLGLEAMLARRPGSLSGGEAQRVAIGRALLAAPDILVMDEPLSQLDGARRAEILPFLERLAHESGVPILYISHAIDEVARLADAIVVLAEGRVLAAGPIEQVFGRFDLGAAIGRHEAGALLVATVRRHDDSFGLTELSVGDATLSVPQIAQAAGAAVRLRVRARDVSLALVRPEGLSIRNVVPATIVSVDPDASADAEILLNVGSQHLRARITRKSASELALRPRQAVFALIKSVSIETGRPTPERLAPEAGNP